MSDLNILVTNDDGIDSVGLRVLATAMRRFGEVTVVAPDSEYSGAGASIGPLHLMETEIRRVNVDGVETAWTVNGPPALCVFYARMGAFEFTPDLIVSGINPGANLGRAVYHSGTIGAVLTGRSAMIPGIAVSQSFADPIDDSERARLDYDERVSRQLWDSAAEVAAQVVAGMVESDFDDVAVVNLNVPNLPVEEMKGWRWTEVGLTPPWAMTEARLVPRPQPGGGAGGGDPAAVTYGVETSWGEQRQQPPETDAAAILDDMISISVLSRLTAIPVDAPAIDARLDEMLDR